MSAPADTARFWMICQRPQHRNSKTQPTARYANRAAAIDDARRLAHQTGRDFVLLEAVEIIRPKDGLMQSSMF